MYQQQQPPYQQQQVPPEVQNFFQAVDVDRSGRINATELQNVLQSSNGQKFSDQSCRLMISLFENPQTKSQLDLNGFAQLYAYVNQWLSTFRQFDRNQSGCIDENELGQALGAMGYRFGQPFFAFLMGKFGTANQGLAVDGFISVCILIHKFTAGFRAKDAAGQGVVQLSYEEFLSIVLGGWA